MAKKIENLKKQIQEISKVVNTFKSEAVQLKVVDLLFKNLSNEPETKSISKPKTVAKPKKKVAAKKLSAPKAKAVSKAAPKAAAKKKVTAKKKVATKAKPVTAAAKKKTVVAKPAKKVAIAVEKKAPAKVAKKVAKAKKVKAKPVTAKKPATKKVAKKSNPAVKTGASGIIRDMQEKGFFTSKRNMNEVVKHFNETLKMPLKITDLSGLVNKLVKENKLKREKNSTTHKYEYVNA
jgi:predicted nucleic acid-binding protein